MTARKALGGLLVAVAIDLVDHLLAAVAPTFGVGALEVSLHRLLGNLERRRYMLDRTTACILPAYGTLALRKTASGGKRVKSLVVATGPFCLGGSP